MPHSKLQLLIAGLALTLCACDSQLSSGDGSPDAAPLSDATAEAAPGPDAAPLSDAAAEAAPAPDAAPLSDAAPDAAPGPDTFPPPPAPCTSKSSCSADLLLGGGKVAYWRTHALDAPNTQLTRGVVVVHGSSLNADDYFGYVVSAAQTAGVLSSTLIVAPRFPESAGASDELFWSSTWRSGGDGSTPGGGATVSSYSVADAIVDKLGDASTFPNLTTIVVTGHSAGGQYAQRYAAAGKASPAGAALRYAPANPSSYLYFNDYRRVNGTFVNSGPLFSACPYYDDYKYGLQDRSAWPYLAAQSDAALQGKYLAREVVYLLGDADTCNEDIDSTCDDHGLATSCSAMLQGDQRYERGQNYWAHINQYFAGHPHKLQVIPGVGHSASQMFNSSGGRAVLFN